MYISSFVPSYFVPALLLLLPLLLSLSPVLRAIPQRRRCRTVLLTATGIAIRVLKATTILIFGYLPSIMAAANAFKAARALTRNASHFMQQTTQSSSAAATAARSSASSTMVQPTAVSSTPTMVSISTFPHLPLPQLQIATLPPHIPLSLISSLSHSAISSITFVTFPLPTLIIFQTNTSTLRRPIPNSYWATPLLLACEYPWSPTSPRPKLDALLTAGVRTFIDLTEPGELRTYAPLLQARARALGLSPSEIAQITYHRFPIPDRGLPQSRAFLQRILALLRECEACGTRTAVHCRGGIGRTGTVVGCWLVQCGIARDGADALRIIAKEWASVEKCKRFPSCPQTPGQFEFVRAFEKMRVSATQEMREDVMGDVAMDMNVAARTGPVVEAQVQAQW